MSNTEAKAWTSSPGRPEVEAEGCRHAIKIDCGICHAEEFEKDMVKEVEPVKHESSKLEIERNRYKSALEDIGSYNGPSVILDIVNEALS